MHHAAPPPATVDGLDQGRGKPRRVIRPATAGVLAALAAAAPGAAPS